ncbi:Leucine-rich repeat-containing protein 40 [Chamberlinius hualienensis]
MSKHMGKKFGAVGPQAVFEQRTKEGDLHPTIIKQARNSGKLNLSNKGLVAVPDKVWRIHEIDDEERKTTTFSFNSSDNDRWWEQAELTVLDLSFNRLSEIHCDIQNLPNLQTVNLQDNLLSGLPLELKTLEHLRNLNLNHNKLGAVPEAVYHLKNLRNLSMKGNTLSELNEELGNLSLLETLDLSGNQLLALPPSVGFLSRVTNLNLSSNFLIALPDEIGCMLGLRQLDISSNRLKSVPSSLSELCHLLQLNLNHNELTELPVLYSCVELKELHGADNHLVELTDEFFEPVLKLQLLDVRDNHINKLSDDIVDLQHLERLDLSNNDLNSLPPKLGHLPHLKSLSLEGNPLKAIRRDVLQRGTVHLLKFLRMRSTEDARDGNGKESSKRLSCSSNLPELDVYCLRKNRCLDLSNLKASDIPENYFVLAAEAEVTIINLSRNQLVQVPESIDLALSKIMELQLASNKLLSIPPIIQSAKYLKFLDVSCNRLENLPDEIVTLTQLREIWINGNKFVQIPSCVYKLKALEILLASDNNIEIIDVEGLNNLSMLATLNLQNNNIHSVPPELGNLVQLRCLQLEGNPFRQPRTAILAKGTNFLLEYLRDRIPK